MYRQILVPLDGSAKAQLALPVARQLAETTGCTIHLLVALTLEKVLFVDRDDSLPQDYQKLSEQQMQMAQEFLRETAASLAGIQVVTQACRQKPSKAICGYAKDHGIDLIVMACREKSALSRWLGGSTAQGVLRNAPCNVMVVRPELVHQVDGQTQTG